jgi:hypothetical protein
MHKAAKSNIYLDESNAQWMENGSFVAGFLFNVLKCTNGQVCICWRFPNAYVAEKILENIQKHQFSSAICRYVGM